MIRKILLALLTIALVVFPFLVGTPIGKHSPYVETNSFHTYVIIWAAVSLAITAMVLLLLKKYAPSFEKALTGGFLLFLQVCPIIGIIGLASAPDLSLKILDHPEREHLRYAFLFLAAVLFGVYALFLFRNHAVKTPARWIVIGIFALAFVEFIWEFNHHYAYPEAMKAWIDQGNSADDFGKSYDNFTIITIGVIGRYLQFLAIIWLSLHLYKLREIGIWSPIVSIIFSLMGIVSATVIFITEMNLPKGYEILFLFFIPGIPFLLLYWIGVAVLTKFRSNS